MTWQPTHARTSGGDMLIAEKPAGIPNWSSGTAGRGSFSRLIAADSGE
ncbi:MAG: hypothetical protein P8J37_21695 [Fuerstiella sp.]|nr:hypothetical protein [Fuerstiella sp.]